MKKRIKTSTTTVYKLVSVRTRGSFLFLYTSHSLHSLYTFYSPFPVVHSFYPNTVTLLTLSSPQ